MSKIIDLKGSILSLTILHVYSDHFESTKEALVEKITQAPDFFEGIPVVIQPEIELNDPTFLAMLVELLHQHKMMPIGIRTQDENIIQQAEYAGLAIFPKNQKKSKATEGPTEKIHSAKIVKGSVRSGQQIYVKDRDLIVYGSVNPGAEVIADGHIHVFGKVRGKLFAGSSGMTEARIFANQLDAELVCISGMYQLAEDIDEQYKSGSVLISLQKDKLVFEKT